MDGLFKCNYAEERSYSVMHNACVCVCRETHRCVRCKGSRDIAEDSFNKVTGRDFPRRISVVTRYKKGKDQ